MAGAFERSSRLQLNLTQRGVSYCGFDSGNTIINVALQRATSFLSAVLAVSPLNTLISTR
jgi:hypothetical protein